MKKIFFLLIVFLISLYSCCYAYTFDEFVEYCTQIRDGIIPCSSLQLKNYGVVYFLNNVNNIRNTVNVDNYSNFVLAQGSYWYLNMNNGCTARVVSSSNLKLENVTSPFWSASFNSSSIRSSSTSSNFINAFTVTVDDACGLVDFVNTNDRGYFNLYDSKKIPLFTPSMNGFINVYNNGVAYSVHRLPFGYVYPKDVTLGYLSNYDDTLIGLEGYFGPIVYSSGDNVVTDSTQAQFNYNYIIGSNNGNLKFDFDTGRISVNSLNMIDKQTYHLYLNYKLINDDWVVEFASVDYFAYFFNSDVISGELINPNLNTDLNIGWINTINSWVNNNDESNQIINNSFPFFSGEHYSGDFFGITFEDRDKYGFSDLFHNLYYGFVNVLTNYDDVTINFGILSNINSSIFKINNSAISSMLGLFTTVFLLILLFIFYYRFIKAINTLDITTIFKYDADSTFNIF